MCFPVKFAKLLRTPISKNICKRLLLPFVGFTKLYHNIFLWFSLSFIKRHEWYIECQWMTTSGTTNDNEWYNEWQRVVQRVTKSDSEWYNEWQQVTTNGNEWEQVTAVVQRMKTAQYTSKNGWLPSFQWQKQIHYYFKGWMAEIRVVR